MNDDPMWYAPMTDTNNSPYCFDLDDLSDIVHRCLLSANRWIENNLWTRDRRFQRRLKGSERVLFLGLSRTLRNPLTEFECDISPQMCQRFDCNGFRKETMRYNWQVFVVWDKWNQEWNRQYLALVVRFYLITNFQLQIKNISHNHNQ